MNDIAKTTRSTIVPALRYRDADRALEFLTRSSALRPGRSSATMPASCSTPNSALATA